MSDHSKITSLIQSLLSGSSMSSNQRKKHPRIQVFHHIFHRVFTIKRTRRKHQNVLRSI